MPESPDTDLEAIKEQAFNIAKEEGSKGEMQAEIIPIAFGLKALHVLAMYEVKEGKDFDEIAAKMKELDGVQSAEVFKMDLAMG